MRPIDLVALRKPKHLLINIGANHGLIDVTLTGVTGFETADFTGACTSPTTRLPDGLVLPPCEGTQLFASAP